MKRKSFAVLVATAFLIVAGALYVPAIFAAQPSKVQVVTFRDPDINTAGGVAVAMSQGSAGFLLQA